MRDAKRIKERNEEGGFGRFGVVALAALGTVVISYNIGLQVGMSRGGSTVEVASAAATPLAALDQAQQKHDAMQFYTRLNQEDPKNTVSPPEPKPAVDNAKPDLPVEPAAAVPVETKETTQGALARLGQATASPEPEAVAGNFTVQVSAFQTEEEADAYRASLNRKGYQPYVVAAEIPGKGMWYRVRVGRFEDKTAANEAKAKLALVNIPSFVVAAQ